jgi:hypothetical protein
MPLDKSASPEAQSRNIAELRHSGYPEAQAVAISYSVKREAENSHSERHEHEKEKYGR